jgi:hypothetical protein
MIILFTKPVTTGQNPKMKRMQMSCYLRHVKPMYPELGVDGDDKTQKKALDELIRHELDMVGHPCSDVWAALKPKMDDKTFWTRVKAKL